ncbi:hypothetical protein CROQUDRAFT_660573 [Cronartium quercuum f. sp. fusiforme G11]|uniref:Inositol polyphosphate-related phosphatase domain-containing protein n=1 Tax=Cronartium quercuum f. sp. fusiforme G11 TaxID=708437 RepID=A0A9P6ND72_9BASI|nr:hypothetical protein CROQUDRAFT_660573 [Cronartium quercuum f. sp. fusiforme G11]
MTRSSKPSALRIRCMTYNLNRGNADSDFLDLLFDQNAVDEADLPDFYVFSFQELAGLHLTFSSFTSSAIYHRHKSIIRALSHGLQTIKGGDPSDSTIDLHALTYNLAAKETYGGLALLIYARSDTVDTSIKNIDIARASCGFLNLMNNKGAVGIRLTIRQPEDPSDPESAKKRGEELITFVTAHLTAHDSGLLARNQDYQSILNKLLFAAPTPSGALATIYDCTHLFFMGDLNYRLTLSPPNAISNAQISRQKLREMLQDGRYPSIAAQYDTLIHQHQIRNVLDGLREGPINFKPSYKYERTRPDQFVDFEYRLPGWTDRIFFASCNDDEPSGSNRDSRSTFVTEGIRKTEVLGYQSVPHLLGSDHKPVWAVFDIPDWHPDPSQRLLSFKNFRQRVRPDRWWREKLWVGFALDRLLGVALLIVLVLGMGSMKLGLVNMLAVVVWKFKKLLR